MTCRNQLAPGLGGNVFGFHLERDAISLVASWQNSAMIQIVSSVSTPVVFAHSTLPT